MENQSENYTPNHITPKERAKCLFFALVFIAYGSIGYLLDDIYIPGKRGGMHFKGYSCAIMYIAFILCAVNFLSVIVDHYDKRNNETNYQRFANLTRIAGWIFFFLAVIVGLVQILNKY